jgi:oligopeptide/dipeptide ABC transporter ATP-binding protein
LLHINKHIAVESEPSSLLDVRGLVTQFASQNKKTIRAADHVDLKINKNEVHGLVGESGCGKSATALSVMRLISAPGRIESGSIHWKDKELLSLSSSSMRKVRGRDIAMVFQNAQASLNPLYTIGEQMVSVVKLHRGMGKKEATAESLRLLKLVRMTDAEERMKAYPHQLSGGMCQRVMIAMALSCRPELLIADEPTASLDVTIQAQIIDLLLDIKKQFDMAILLISHDMGVVARMCDTVSVMYLGKIVECADVITLFHSPKHPYTKALLESVPVPDPKVSQKSKISGDIPSILNIPNGCRFNSRCPHMFEKCLQATPTLQPVDNEGNKVACWLYE